MPGGGGQVGAGGLHLVDQVDYSGLFGYWQVFKFLIDGDLLAC